MTPPSPRPDPDMEAILDALEADENDERTYQLLAVMHDEDEGRMIEAKRHLMGPG